MPFIVSSLSVNTAILVFAQPVARDAVWKHLSAHADSNCRALNALNGRVRQTACQTGLPVLFSTDLIAHTGSFGEQLSEAIKAAFGQGFDKVLVVGNDCPALTTTDLTNAAAELQAGRVVLGPDNRGGVYLLGLSRGQFEADVLRGLPWQTNRLHRALQVCFENHTVGLLHTLGDLNRRADILAYQTDSQSLNVFVSLLLRLIDRRTVRINQSIVHRAIQPDVYRTGPLRAPPVPALHSRF